MKKDVRKSIVRKGRHMLGANNLSLVARPSLRTASGAAVRARLVQSA